MKHVNMAPLAGAIPRWLAVDELNMLMESHFPEIAMHVAWQSSPASVAFEVCATAERHGCIPDLLRTLAGACPSFEPDIRAIANDLGVPLPVHVDFIRLIPPQRRQRRVFLSYSRKDEYRAAPIQALLEAVGVQVFKDTDLIRAGDEWEARLDVALRTVHQVLVLWSEHARSSEWVRREVTYAMELVRRHQLSQFVLVWRLDDAEADILASVQHIDARVAMPERDPGSLTNHMPADERNALIVLADALRRSSGQP